MSKILKRVLIVALLLLLVFGCAGSSKKTKPAGQPVPSNQMDESFDPLTLHDEDLVIEGEKTTATEPLHPAEVTLPEEKNVPENKLVDGFRIQIISTKSLENATRAKQIASEQFSDLNGATRKPGRFPPGCGVIRRLPRRRILYPKSPNLKTKRKFDSE